ncbi:MAG: Phenazine biosynthesis PhzC/PhzF protein, partial [Polaromonas sp.]|nr:Phenazine biosynthesis PhzC/PhzF protein [Polaromonas sp.]
YFGNPLAVVLAPGADDGPWPDDAAMQRFAHWTNLSETTFLLPPTDPQADYRVRIFTPGGELPFAGHPTLGSCHSWLEAGGQPRQADVIVQQCQVGLVKIRREPAPAGGSAPRLAFAAPPLKRSAPSPMLLAQVAAALGLKSPQITAAQVLDNGPVWLGLLLDSPETVLRLQPNHLELDKLKVKVGVAALYAEPEPPALIVRRNREARAFASAPAAAREVHADLEVRAFAACIGINEDPVTGSFNASLAQWLVAEGYLPARYVASQGVCLGRAGVVHLERDAAGQVWVGGDTVTCISGTVAL